MNENKIKNFLVNGFTIKEGSGEIPVDIADTEEEIGNDDCGTEDSGEIYMETTEPAPENEDMKEIRSELLKIRYILEDLKDREPAVAEPQPVKVEMPDMSAYLTSKEQMKTLTSSLDKRDAATLPSRRTWV